jgi:hypothetical protein
MSRKWIIGIAVVCALLLLAVYLWDITMNLPTPPHSSLEALVPEGEPVDDWWQLLEREAEESPNGEGLRHLANALSLVRGRISPELNQSLGRALHSGWENAELGAIQALNENADAMAAALMAVDELPFDLPGPRHPLDPPPRMLEFGALIRLLALDSLRLETEGNHEEAVDRALDAIRLCDLLCSENQPLISHMVGLVAMRDTLEPLSTMLAHPALPDELVEAVAEALAQIDRDHVSVAAAIRAEGENRLKIFAMSIYDPVLREQWWSRARNDWPRRGAVRRSIRNPDELGDLIRAVHDWSATEIDKPPWERTTTTPPFVEHSVYREIVLATVLDVERLGSIQDHTVACLRLARAQCALILGESIEDIIDPFSGQAIKVASASVSSVGPDGIPQMDGAVYDPTNGVPSAGDIIAPLR